MINISCRPIKTIFRYIQTVRHLKPSQIFYRILYRYRTSDLTGDLIYERNSNLLCSDFYDKPESYSENHTFFFIGREVHFPEQVDWSCNGLDTLWSYNLHYFDFINSRNSNTNTLLALIDDWIKHHQPQSKPGWASYPTSLRIVNWIKFDLKHGIFSEYELNSLFTQCRWLCHRIEYDILANHLLANAKALLFGGMFFKGPEPGFWLKTGMSILNKELDEQINSDGSHFELSPMYHSIVLEDLLDIRLMHSLDNPVFPAELVFKIDKLIEHMMVFTDSVTHPDGEVAFFNDSAMGISLNQQQLLEYRATVHQILDKPSAPQSIRNKKESTGKYPDIPSSGYIKSLMNEFCLISNVAPIAPSYQPAHSHADTLSFELSICQQRVLVNSGTSTYNISALRDFQRSTRAHNTIEIDDKNSSDVWSAFRVAKRAKVLHHSRHTSKEKLIVSGSHGGYKTWFGGVIHSREWTLENQKLTVKDTLDGRYRIARLFFYFHPDVSLESDNILKIPDGRHLQWVSTQSNLNWKKGLWYPRFGKALENIYLQIDLDCNSCIRKISNQVSLIT